MQTPLAIPSPDVVLSLVASAGQMLGLVAVLFGRVLWWRSQSVAAEVGEPRPSSRRSTAVLAVLLVLVGLSFLLYHLAELDREKERLTTNLNRSSQEAGRTVGDTSLKTLAFSDQIGHPQGMTTQKLAERIAAGERLNLIDVREPEECETGRIPGTWHIRYPDLRLAPDKLRVEGARTVLLCHSGNRSSELCEEFGKLGIETWFLIGGYEKWIAEGRDLSGGVERHDLRAIPAYPNSEVLLDTPEVTEMFRREDLLFLDVRYEDDFRKGHLPDAINLPIRRMPTEEMNQAIAALPRRPIAVPCYDKRSSFYAAILGLRLHRAGLDFRGRYTVPDEFWVPTNEREHVAAWRNSRQKRTLLDVLADPLGKVLLWVRDRVTGGSLVLAILLLVLSMRLLTLPLTLRADRDRIVQQRLAPRLQELKRRFADDPGRAMRAVSLTQRDAGLRPLRGLLGSLVVLVLFLVLFPVVSRAAEGSTESFLWLPAIGKPDPLFLLPILVGLQSAALVLAGAARVGPGKLALAAGFGLGMSLLTAFLVAAVGLYLVLNLGLVLLQSRIVRRAMTGRERRQRRRNRPRGPLVPLEAADLLPTTGGKAWHLGRLIGFGMPVPPGFVVLGEAELERDGAAILSCFDALDAAKVAVRSSGAREDGHDKSYAGVFDTRLNVDRASLLEAIAEVRRSLRSARAEAYAGDGDEQGAVVVQAMVDAEYAGVLFSEDPASTGSLMVEMVAGLGEDLVSGRVTPQTFRFGRATRRLLGDEVPPIDLLPLLELAAGIEDGFGQPVDVEWAWSRGRFQILQARDITATAHDGEDERALVEAERSRLLARYRGADPKEVLLAQDDLAVLLPEPTAISAALMEGLWASGGTVDLACRALGVPYELREDGSSWVVTAFGRTFVDLVESGRRRGHGPGAMAAFRMTRSAEAQEQRLERFLERREKDCLLRDAVDLSRLSLPVIVGMFTDTLRGFTTLVYVEAERINIAAEYHLEAARERLLKKGFDPAEHLGSLPRTVVQEAHELLADPALGVDEAVQRFLALFGHRATHDFELAEPRYRELPDQVRARAEALREGEEPAQRTGSRRPPSLGTVLDLLVDRARRFQTLKERAKHESLREVDFLRRLLCDIGARTGFDELVFDLLPAEIPELLDPGRLPTLRRRARRRSLAREAFRRMQVPARLSLADIEVLGLPDALRGVEIAARDGTLCGARVSGTGTIEGRARVLCDKSELSTFERDEILVARWTDPDWTPLFAKAKGIVTEVGGWLSHAAIQAREYHLPAIVGAVGAADRLVTGDLVRLHPDGRVEAFDDRRRARRLPVEGRVVVEWDSVRIRARLLDFSRNGVGIDVPAPHPDTGASCRLHLRGGLVVSSRLAVVRGATRLGFCFDEPLGRGQLEQLLDRGGEDGARRLGS